MNEGQIEEKMKSKKRKEKTEQQANLREEKYIGNLVYLNYII